MPQRPATVEVLGFRLALLDLEEAARWLLAATSDPEPRVIVTLNPEIVVRAESEPGLREALSRADVSVADGVGMLWAGRRQGHYLPGRVPGVELVSRAMELGGAGLRVYFLGGRPGVAARAAQEASRRWGTAIAGSHHGYFGAAETPIVIEAIREARPHLLLAGLGEGQEEFLDRHRERLGARVMVGVGGTLDVLAGEARRTPVWTRRLHLEWAWRVGLDRRRWHRFPRLLDFVRLVLASSR